MPEKGVWLFWLALEGSPDEFEARAHHSDLAGAKAQAQADIASGRRVLRIEDEEGKVLWKPRKAK